MRCAVDLARLFETDRQRDNFEAKWPAFLDSDVYNRRVFRKDGHILSYRSEQLIPRKTDPRPPLLLVFGNPAAVSVDSGVFFSFDEKGREHRFWRHILKPAGVADLPHDPEQPVKRLNRQRRKALFGLAYASRFRIGMSVMVSMPSAASVKDWSGVDGVRRLLGQAALRRLEAAETRRVLAGAKRFVRPGGAVIAFQKDAWECLKSGDDPGYDLETARAGKLRGTLKDGSGMPLLGVPPTRLTGVCSRVLKQMAEEIG